MSEPLLYSIGYATKPIEVFIAQLKTYAIDAIADVRSVPYSKVFHDYHRETLAAKLNAIGIHYVYLGEELGPRSKDDAHYDEQRQIQFDRLMRAPLYLSGIKRLQAGLDKGMRIAVMCAEKDPADCHRSLLIGYQLQRELTINLQHITHEGKLETQTEMEARLIHTHGLDNDLFANEHELADQACKIQCRLKAYRRPE